MKIRLISRCAVVLSLAVSTPLSAQTDLPGENVQVVKDFEAGLEESERIPTQPVLPEIKTSAKEFDYSSLKKDANIEYLAPRIKPLALKTEKLPPVYDGYLKLGGGVPSSIFGEAAYNYQEGDTYEIGAYYKHHSANNKKVEYQRFSDDQFKLGGRYFFEQGFALGAQTGYRSSNEYFYGFDPQDTSYNEDQARQQFKVFDLGLNVFNGVRTQGDIDYRVGMDFYHMTERFLSEETGFGIHLNGTKWISEKHPVSLAIGNDLTVFRDSASQNLNNFYIRPNFTYHADAFKVKVGTNIISFGDEFRFFPDMELSINILPSQLSLVAGWQGDATKNTLRSLTQTNPYLSSYLQVRNTAWTKYYGGLKGKVNALQYELQAGYKKAQDLAFYMRNSLDTRKFDVLYDTAGIVYLEGALELNSGKDLTIRAAASSNLISPDNLEKPFYLPQWEANLSVRYKTLKDKLFLKGEFYMQEGVAYLNENNLPDNLNTLLDISFGAEYYVHKNLGIFLDIMNLPDNKRQRWYRYPTYGMNVLGGISLRF